MPLRRASVIPFKSSGVTDTIEGTNSPPGSMEALTNLIPSPSTAGLFVCRPASELLTDFTGFTTPGFISVIHVEGSLIYGLIASATISGHDEPFCYDMAANAFITVTGATIANTPVSPATSGDWTPPIIAGVGVYRIVTHPGFAGGAGAYFGWFNVSNPAAPTWDAGNTATNPLPAVPVSVAQFNGRGWYAVGNAVWFTDALDPLTITDADQILTLGDNTDVTALGPLPLNSALVGGVNQALLAFKGVSIIYQITGDVVTNDLSDNAIDVSTGTLAPNTIVQTPKGVAFVGPTGLRFIDFNARISDPIGTAGTGITVPFIYSSVPSRMCAAYGSNVIRITVQNGSLTTNPFQEWWFHIDRLIWTGPHTFPASLIHATTHTSGTEHPSFVVAPVGVTHKLFDSHSVQGAASTYVENGTTLGYVWRTSLLPDTEAMAVSFLVETTVGLSLISGFPALVVALDEQANVINSVQVVGPGSPTIWGAFIWGSANWGGAFTRYMPRPVYWTEPVVFNRLQVQVTGLSEQVLTVGNMYMRYQITGYMNQDLAFSRILPPLESALLTEADAPILTESLEELLI